MQSDLFHCKVTLHVSGVTAPIIKSTKNCNRSLRYRSKYRYSYFPPTWPGPYLATLVTQHPSSGVLKTVTAASGTGHNISTATSLQRGQIGPIWPCWRAAAVLIFYIPYFSIDNARVIYTKKV